MLAGSPNPAGADQLRISPDDLRLRVAVSEELPASLRRELVDLAGAVPLPVEDGVTQSERLIRQQFEERGWSRKRSVLAYYYFLVARLEQGKTFSNEFLRREQVLRKGRSELKAYIEELNPLIALAVYTDARPLKLELVQDFPLSEVARKEDGALLVRFLFPPPDTKLGRNNLRYLRTVAQKEREVLEDRLDLLRAAEDDFLAEVSHLGRELIDLRDDVKEWVTPPGEGLPFSP